MCAASPARKTRPWRMGSVTWLRIGSTAFEVIRPRASFHPGASSVAKRASSSSQTRASDQSPGSVPLGTWRYRRLTDGERMLARAKPRSE